jgi:hypothetical protein
MITVSSLLVLSFGGKYSWDSGAGRRVAQRPSTISNRRVLLENEQYLWGIVVWLSGSSLQICHFTGGWQMVDSPGITALL